MTKFFLWPLGTDTFQAKKQGHFSFKTGESSNHMPNVSLDSILVRIYFQPIFQPFIENNIMNRNKLSFGAQIIYLLHERLLHQFNLHTIILWHKNNPNGIFVINRNHSFKTIGFHSHIKVNYLVKGFTTIIWVCTKCHC